MEGENSPQQVSQQPIQRPEIAYSAPENNEDSGGVRKVFSFISWTFLVVFLPITVLIFLSQDSIPGDFFYPVKRGMENVILAAASVNPSTKAAFKTGLTEVRFNEATKLLAAKSDTAGLSDFISEVQTTQTAVNTVSDPLQKKQLTEKLISKIDEYQNKLVQVQSQVQNNAVSGAVQAPLQNTIQQQAVSQPPQQVIQNMTSLTPSPTTVSVSSPTSAIPTAIPTPTLVLTQLQKQNLAITQNPTPTPTPIPQVQIPPSAINPQTISSANSEVKSAIGETQKKLEEIKNQLEKRDQEEKSNRENSDNKKDNGKEKGGVNKNENRSSEK